MKLPGLRSLFLTLPILLASIHHVGAQTNAYDDAYHYNHASATWATIYQGVNYGFGYTPWMCVTNGPGSHGFFTTHDPLTTPLPTINSPTNCCDAPGNNNRQHVWGIFANGTGANTAIAFRGFSNALTADVVFKLQWQCDGIGAGGGNQAGFVLRNGNVTNSFTDARTGQRFSFYFVGGGVNSFKIQDNNGVTDVGIALSSLGMNCEFTLEANDTYRFVIRNATNNAIMFITDGAPLDTFNSPQDSTIDSVALFAQQTSANQEFNRMQISSTSLIPPSIINLQPTNGSIYVDAGANNVSFEVDSTASVVHPTNVTLVLNGVQQSGLVFNASGFTNQLLVTNTIPLIANLFYSGTIVTQDANHNAATNSFTFNTFLPNNLCIDAEDYNYGSGQFFPNPAPNAYFGLIGSNGVDYLEKDLTGVNNTSGYRSGDLPQTLQVTGDPYDHAGFQAVGASDYEIGFTDNAEWQNYTRDLDSTSYTIYARAASAAGNGNIMIGRLANSTATTSNQPAAALGTCLIPATGGSKIYSGPMVPLTDFFSNPVEIRFPGTSTFRTTSVNFRTYNLNYLMFVPNTNTATLKPYLSAGYPYPGAGGVALESTISFTIANRETAVNPGTIQLLVDSNNVTGGISLSNNAAGTVVSYLPSTFLAPNSNHTVLVVFTDNGVVPKSTTNLWQFTTINTVVTAVPPEDALPPGSGTTAGFGIHIYKVDNAAPTTATLANAELELSGSRIDPNTSLPYPNLAGGPNGDGLYSEVSTINYDIAGVPTGTPTFGTKAAFPYVAAGGQNNNIALEAVMYLQLNAGNYVIAVRSDDGFKLTAGPTPGDTNLVLGFFDGGRGNGAPSTMYLTVQTSGVYPMRLLYFQAGSGGNVEFYSLNNGTPVLINDPNVTGSIKAYQAVVAIANPVTILNPAHSGNTTTFSFLSQAGHTHYVEYKNALTDANWAPLTTNIGDGTIKNVSDSTASGAARLYRIRTQ